ncbi:hypothetical protein C9374_008277 [Naegleria lovaniensis]|uniref:serine O-acetyltransferase n=1 Tax=Naegleria lovaniensis TaxID=51637 RepID=A0AA88GLY6_NAELO|nr:uncharacterized protein C9374_010822 [Naegleria lovaniensis]XP_044545900.1 uncharacterized protein C9374_008277 [Naegleria lovaniensis]KAG2374538.1 hypothetical protein C9374_010822 [Naegleria lovaniensis]KAG2378638.1 hypothetical protein C9374_008277 [Naegleria lovaniensis]
MTNTSSSSSDRATSTEVLSVEPLDMGSSNHHHHQDHPIHPTIVRETRSDSSASTTSSSSTTTSTTLLSSSLANKSYSDLVVMELNGVVSSTTDNASSIHHHHDEKVHHHLPTANIIIHSTQPPNNQENQDFPKKKMEEGEQLLSSLSKISTTKQKPHLDNQFAHTQVCVCPEPLWSQIRADVGVIIDNDPGVVIGETAIVGNYCTLYQGVTLGGTSTTKGKRHPTLGDNVLVGSGAKVLGNIVIGSNVKIGAGSVVVKDAPSDCTLVGVPARCIKDKKPTVNTNNSNNETMTATLSNGEQTLHTEMDASSSTRMESGANLSTISNGDQQPSIVENLNDGLLNGHNTAVTSTSSSSQGHHPKNLSIDTKHAPPATTTATDEQHKNFNTGVMSPTTVINFMLNAFTKQQEKKNIDAGSTVYQYDDIDAQAIRALYLREKRLEQELERLKKKLKLAGIFGDSSEDEEGGGDENQQKSKHSITSLKKSSRKKQVATSSAKNDTTTTLGSNNDVALTAELALVPSDASREPWTSSSTPTGALVGSNNSGDYIHQIAENEEECFKVLFESTGSVELVDGGGI